MLIKAALVTCGLVCMNESFAGCAINDRHGSSICLSGLVAVTTLDCGEYFFDRCTHVGTLTGVPLTVFFCLSCAL